ncbi:hypothetical protein [Streptomyces sp. NPDC026659]|uniref:hypothetical protein n=1 Tax=Streptomyces sp. NPDC026659 TaxID=3155123 RepID=UPI0034038963
MPDRLPQPPWQRSSPSPERPTPTGYKLRRGAKTTDYIYKSGDVFAIEASCSWRKDAADGAASGVAVDKQKIVKGFGNTVVVTKFPMVNLMVDFADGSHATGDDGKAGEKSHGWDVCVTRTTTKLCHTTGDGS